MLRLLEAYFNNTIVNTTHLVEILTKRIFFRTFDYAVFEVSILKLLEINK